jgi:tol-pal system protein YbgF
MSMVVVRAATAACALVCLAVSADAQELRPPGVLTPAQRQDRVEELERLLQQSTDENERLQHQLRQAQAEVRRLQSMVSDLAAVRDARDEIGSGASESRSPAPSPPPARDRQSQRTPPPPPAPTPAQQGSLGTLPASDLPSDPAVAYQQARELLLNGQTRQAEQAFSDFLSRYSNDSHAPEARYWHSFVLLARDAHQEAADGFVAYLRGNPRGQRAADALFRLGVALKGLGRNQQACQVFTDLPARYPQAARSLRDQAARERTALRCRA